MNSILAVLIFIFLIYAIIKIGSKVWQIIGVILLILILWAYKESIWDGIQQFIQDPSGYLQKIQSYFTDFGDRISSWWQ
jgi:hypothetical protein